MSAKCDSPIEGQKTAIVGSRSIRPDVNVITFPETYMSGRMLQLPTKLFLMKAVVADRRLRYPPVGSVCACLLAAR